VEDFFLRKKSLDFHEFSRLVKTAAPTLPGKCKTLALRSILLGELLSGPAYVHKRRVFLVFSLAA
jgi:hypothetical protein